MLTDWWMETEGFGADPRAVDHSLAAARPRYTRWRGYEMLESCGLRPLGDSEECALDQILDAFVGWATGGGSRRLLRPLGLLPPPPWPRRRRPADAPDWDAMFDDGFVATIDRGRGPRDGIHHHVHGSVHESVHHSVHSAVHHQVHAAVHHQVHSAVSHAARSAGHDGGHGGGGHH